MTAAVAAQHSRRGAKKIPLEPCFCSPQTILFENDLLLCVNKRSGTRVTPFNRLTNQMSCLNLAYGGALLFAKTSEAAKKFGGADFWQKHVRKTYLALVEADECQNLQLQDEEVDAAEHDGSAGPAREEDDRDVPRNKPIFFLVDSPIDGKRAQTTVEIFALRRGGSGTKIFALAKCELKEGGRRHQIRKHCASIGWPLVGDREYNTTTHKGPFFLHAWKLEIGGENQTLDLSENQRLLDTNRSPIRITAPLPERFLEEVAKWEAGLPDLLFGPGGPLAEGQEVQLWELGRELEHHF
eukprot:g12916.t1